LEKIEKNRKGMSEYFGLPNWDNQGLRCIWSLFVWLENYLYWCDKIGKNKGKIEIKYQNIQDGQIETGGAYGVFGHVFIGRGLFILVLARNIELVQS
jgi:hypothetical protein